MYMGHSKLWDVHGTFYIMESTWDQHWTFYIMGSTWDLHGIYWDLHGMTLKIIRMEPLKNMHALPSSCMSNQKL